MPNIPGTIFQEPGRDTEQAGTEKPQVAQGVTADPQSVTEPRHAAEPDAQPAAEVAEPVKPKRRRAAARPGPSSFPVHVVKPHPLAFARAQEILEANSSYTKILPGDEPGTIIVR